MMRQHRRIVPETRDRKTRFDDLNQFVSRRNGWLISVPGAVEITVEVLVDSSLPDELAQAGYRLVPEGSGERILASAIVEHFVRRADGELEPLRNPNRSGPLCVAVIVGIGPPRNIGALIAVSACRMIGGPMADSGWKRPQPPLAG